MLHLALRGVGHQLVERLGPFDGRAADGLVAGSRILLQVNAREERGHLVILVLRPALERMVVAFVAVEPGGEEEVRRVLHRLRRRPQHLVVACGRVVLVGSGGGQNLPHELVVGRVGVDLLADPFTEELRALGPEEFPVHLEQVGPLVRPMLHKRGRSNELVDEFFPLGLRVAFVRDERADFVGGGRKAGEVEEDPADEVRVRTKPAGQDLHPFPFGRDELVHPVEGDLVLPLETRTVAHDGDSRRGIRAFVAGEHRSLTAAQGGDDARRIGGNHVDIAALDEGLGRDIARAAVGVGRDDAHLLAAADHLHDGITREQLDAGDTRRRLVELRAGRDPLPEDAVILRADRHALAALVGHGPRGLHQHQARVGRGDVHAS